jgi:hypothetical protein
MPALSGHPGWLSNLKPAKMMGRSLPQSILARGDVVIE